MTCLVYLVNRDPDAIIRALRAYCGFSRVQGGAADLLRDYKAHTVGPAWGHRTIGFSLCGDDHPSEDGKAAGGCWTGSFPSGTPTESPMHRRASSKSLVSSLGSETTLWEDAMARRSPPS